MVNNAIRSEEEAQECIKRLEEHYQEPVLPLSRLVEVLHQNNVGIRRPKLAKQK